MHWDFEDFRPKPPPRKFKFMDFIIIALCSYGISTSIITSDIILFICTIYGWFRYEDNVRENR